MFHHCSFVFSCSFVNKPLLTFFVVPPRAGMKTFTEVTVRLSGTRASSLTAQFISGVNVTDLFFNSLTTNPGTCMWIFLMLRGAWYSGLSGHVIQKMVVSRWAAGGHGSPAPATPGCAAQRHHPQTGLPGYPRHPPHAKLSQVIKAFPSFFFTFSFSGLPCIYLCFKKLNYCYLGVGYFVLRR